jgi:hypothetical protein
MRAMRLAVLAGITLGLVGGVPAGGAVAAAANSVPAQVMTDQRPCDTAQRPKQIRLVLQGGSVRCYGGVVGPLDLPNLNIETVVAGDYTGIVWCKAGLGWFGQSFRPGQIQDLKRTCQLLYILPAD